MGRCSPGYDAIRCRRRRRRVAAVAVLGGLIAAATRAPASAQMTIEAGTVVARPGDAVVVPIRATTTSPLTLLNVDVTFARALCDVIANQIIRSAGRTTGTPEEGGTFCPAEGRIRLVYLNLSGATVVPAGSGPIAEWAFTLSAAAGAGEFPLAVTVNSARNGPLSLDLVPSPGSLQILAATESTPTPSPSATSDQTPMHTPTVTAIRTPTGGTPGAPTSTASATPTRTPTVTATRSASSTPTHTPTGGTPGPPTSTFSATPTRTATEVATPTPTRFAIACVGDCNGSGEVVINELIVGVNIALGNAALGACESFDADGDLRVAINELIQAVNNALNGCLLVFPLCAPDGGCLQRSCGTLEGALPLSVTGATAGDVSGALGSCGGSGSPEQGFLFTAPEAGLYTASTAGSSFDTVLYVRRGGCTGPEVACNDDSGDLTSRVTFPLAAGERSLIVVDGFGFTSFGDFRLALAASPIGASCQTPANPVRNCGFESGDLTGWIAADLSDPLLPLQVATAGVSLGFGFFTSAPSEGIFSAVHGFDGAGPGAIALAQDVTLPAEATTLRFDYRAAWDLASFSVAAQDRRFLVDVEPSGGGAPLGRTLVLRAAAGTIQADTGPQDGAVDIASFAGGDVRLTFRWDIPEEFTGPGFFDLDNVRVL